MLNKVSYLILLLGSFYTSCTPPWTMTEPSQRIFQSVTEVETAKEEIFENSLKWLAENFISSKEVLEYKNKDEGKIIGNIVLKVNVSEGIMDFIRPIRMTLIIEAKENRFRITCKNLIYEEMTFAGSVLPSIPLEYKENLNKTFSKINIEIVNSLKNYLSKDDTNNDW